MEGDEWRLHAIRNGHARDLESFSVHSFAMIMTRIMIVIMHNDDQVLRRDEGREGEPKKGESVGAGRVPEGSEVREAGQDAI